jgi:VWFA-related protein
LAKFVPLLSFFLFHAALSLTAFGQNPAASPTPDDEGVVKISTSLIQVDAVVIDKSGKQLTDLARGDFQIRQDGKLQTITSVIYVSKERRSTTRVKRDRNDVEAPSSFSNAGRMITFVLDDGNCFSTPEGNFSMRNAMEKFVNERMLPDDRVAIYRTKGGISLLQIYTSDKKILRQKISKLTMLGPGGCGGALSDASNRIDRSASPIQRNQAFDPVRIQRDYQLLATIGTLSAIVDRLRVARQRHEIFLLSEGFAIDQDSRSRDALRDLADKAARASVVVHTISTRGLEVPGLITAADSVRASDTERISNQKIDEANALNGGLSYLSYSTGGKFVLNTTEPENSIQRILNLERGYYLIAYEPESDTFDGKEFHKIEVKVNRPDLIVTSRKGFIGRSDSELAPKIKGSGSDLFRIIASSFQDNGIDLRSTILVGNTAAEGNFIRVMFHIKGTDLKLGEVANGNYKLLMDVAAVVFDEGAKVAGEFNRNYVLQVPTDSVPIIMKNGIDFSADIPIKRPGLYSCRIVVRDAVTKLFGSSGEYFEVPDVKGGKFFATGLVVTAFRSDGKPIIPTQRAPEKGFDYVMMGASPAVRQYRRGETLVYAYTVYNPKANGKTVSLTRQIRLFRDGKMLLDTGEKPISVSSIADLSRIDDIGNLSITDQVALGSYEIQIIVRDKNANELSQQAIDFEVVER